MIAIPTDTVYGIACLVNEQQSIQRLYAIKERELIKAIPVLIGTLEQISSIAASFPSAANTLSQHFWPGALTLIVNKHPDLPLGLTSFPTVDGLYAAEVSGRKSTGALLALRINL